MKVLNFFVRFVSHVTRTQFGNMACVSFNSQKETMMQVANQIIVKNELLDEIYAPPVSVKSDEAKELESNVLIIQKTKNLNRFLEASCDCV
jgi:hypothetical protein